MAKISIPSKHATEELEFGSLVIVGANGSGKSRLGIQIEENNENVHRISAQRSLVFKEEIDIRSVTASESMYRYGYYADGYSGSEEERLEIAKQQRRNRRWNNRPASHLLNDFDHLLSLLISNENLQSADFKFKYKAGERPDEYPESQLDRVLKIWNTIMPHRHLNVADNRLQATNKDDSYHGLDMSDGERVAFYLIAQAMCAPENCIIIIDEPELHLHKAIQSKLWDAIEAERFDCSIVYVTHDLEFAASRVNSSIIWVKEFDGKEWDWEAVSDVDGFPREMMLEILGSRKPVLFVEGTRSSIDTQLYRRIYPDFHVIAREGCAKVIESTRALRRAEGFHSQEVFGIIDRDFRAEEDIAGLLKDWVYVTSVAEAENGICLPIVIKCAARHFRKVDDAEVMRSVVDAAFERLSQQLNHQVKEKASQEIRHALSKFSSKNITDREGFEASVTDFKDSIDALKFYDEAYHEYNKVIDAKDYSGLLRIFNNKGLEDVVAREIGFSNKQNYREWVIAEIDLANISENPSELGKEILEGLREEFPEIVMGSTQYTGGINV
jgi:ABC-type cobalamin/Fe3+-siderophores transport system ATPase subunit